MRGEEKRGDGRRTYLPISTFRVGMLLLNFPEILLQSSEQCAGLVLEVSLVDLGLGGNNSTK